MYCSLCRKADIQDSENPGDYTYKFSPCETFKCDSGDTDPDAKVRMFVVCLRAFVYVQLHITLCEWMNASICNTRNKNWQMGIHIILFSDL